jgi:hypothetical protein
MAKEADLFEDTGGSPLEAFLLLKSTGGNVPPMWIERARESRQHRQKDVARVLKKGKVNEINVLRDWELSFKKECFYYGIRVLFELDRKGKSEM